MEQQSSQKIEASVSRCARLLEKSQGLLVVTGAGISAESGIPPYRGPGGIFENTPETQSLLSEEGLAREPGRIWNYINDSRKQIDTAEPSPAHQILACWEKERRFKRFLVATQNIDGLHQKAGSRRVAELHGSIWQMACPRTVDYAEDEQFSNDFSHMMSSGGNEEILQRWSEENNRTIWEDRQVPFDSIPPYRDPEIRPNMLFFNEGYGNRLLWVEDFIGKGVDTVLVIGCSGGVAILDRLVRQCRKANPACTVVNINPYQDGVEQEHFFVPLGASAAMESLNNRASTQYQLSTTLPSYAEETELAGFEDEDRHFHLHPAALEKWRGMKIAAAFEDVHLYLVSTFRSIDRQKEIIEHKRQKGIPEEEIFAVSAPPGHSEHHTGRAIDLNTPGCAPLEKEFENTEAFHWLTQHAAEYGFLLSYPRDNPYGIAYEPWHWCLTQ